MIFSIIKRFWRAGTVLFLSVTLFVAVPQSANAFFGIGDIVVVAKLVQQIHELQRIYEQSRSTYELAKQQAQRISQMRRRDWVRTALGLAQNETGNRFGENSTWSAVANGVAPNLSKQAWQDSTVRIDPSVDMSRERLGQSDQLSALATAEQLDGSSIQCLNAVSNYRQHRAADAEQIRSLQDALASDSLGLNTSAEQADLAAAIAASNASEQRDQGLLKTCALEQQVIRDKQLRDDIAGSLNFNEKYKAYLLKPTKRQ